MPGSEMNVGSPSARAVPNFRCHDFFLRPPPATKRRRSLTLPTEEWSRQTKGTETEESSDAAGDDAKNAVYRMRKIEATVSCDETPNSNRQPPRSRATGRSYCNGRYGSRHHPHTRKAIRLCRPLQVAQNTACATFMYRMIGTAGSQRGPYKAIHHAIALSRSY
jgi:hypothetical protein